MEAQAVKRNAEQDRARPAPIVGIDLGEINDYTAIALVERHLVRVGAPFEITRPASLVPEGVSPFEDRQRVKREYRVRYLERPPLGIGYPNQIRRIVKLIKQVGARSATGEVAVAVDITGAGRGVAQHLWEALEDALQGTRISIDRANISITAGERVTHGDGQMGVPKVDLVSAPLVLMQNGQLKIAKELDLAATLEKELLNFRRKQKSTRSDHMSFEHWREGDHDDLVLSVALACWVGEKYFRGPADLPA